MTSTLEVSDLLLKFGKCELCDQPAKVGMNDKENKLHFSCIDHVNQLWDKIGKP